MQRDFVEPDGGLYIQGAEATIPRIAALISEARTRGESVAWSQDWHPSHTPHFQSLGGVWPAHCVAGTPGAELVPELSSLLAPDDIVVRKGTDGEDGYSAFTTLDIASGATRQTTLDAALRSRGASHLKICGVATDWCVRATALDALALGYTVEIVLSATASAELTSGAGAAAAAEIKAAGGVIC